MSKPREYDYIGAGAAGNVLAARLTEDAGTTVLLLKACGPDAFVRARASRRAT